MSSSEDDDGGFNLFSGFFSDEQQDTSTQDEDLFSFGSTTTTSGTTSQSSVLPDWLQGNTAAVLKRFGKSPVGFVLGIILSTIVGVIAEVTSALLRAVNVVFFGSGPGTDGKLGIVDLPTFIGELIAAVLGPGGPVGGAIVAAVRIPFDAFQQILAAVPPTLEPIVIAGGVAGSTILIARILRFLLEVGADAIPGAEALLP